MPPNTNPATAISTMQNKIDLISDAAFAPLLLPPALYMSSTPYRGFRYLHRSIGDADAWVRGLKVVILVALRFPAVAAFIDRRLQQPIAYGGIWGHVRRIEKATIVKVIDNNDGDDMIMTIFALKYHRGNGSSFPSKPKAQTPTPQNNKLSTTHPTRPSAVHAVFCLLLHGPRQALHVSDELKVFFSCVRACKLLF